MAILGLLRARKRLPMLTEASGMCRKPSDAAAASCTCAQQKVLLSMGADRMLQIIKATTEHKK